MNAVDHKQEVHPPRSSSAVRRIFSREVSSTYERVNHLLTFGVDILWRKRLAAKACTVPGSRFCDLCTGTGETAVYLRRFLPPECTVYAVDFSSDMLSVAAGKPESGGIRFIASDVRHLPFEEHSIDVLTI